MLGCIYILASVGLSYIFFYINFKLFKLLSLPVLRDTTFSEITFFLIDCLYRLIC